MGSASPGASINNLQDLFNRANYNRTGGMTQTEALGNATSAMEMMNRQRMSMAYANQMNRPYPNFYGNNQPMQSMPYVHPQMPAGNFQSQALGGLQYGGPQAQNPFGAQSGNNYLSQMIGK